MSYELSAVEHTIESEIEAGATQPEIAKTYALGLLSGWPTDWSRVNRAIVKRWSLAGLERVKRLAWRRVERIDAMRRAGELPEAGQ